MRRKRHRLWITLFALGAGLLVALGTGWGLVVQEQYSRFVELARDFTRRDLLPDDLESRYWQQMILGILGFVAVLVVSSLLLVRLLREMKLNQLQSEFLARVSHELKSPVTSLELVSSLLQSGPASAAETRRLWTIHESELLRLRVEIEILLEASRLETGGLHPDLRPLDLEAWLEYSVSRWTQILGPGGELRREGEPLRAEVRLDRRLMDLVGNNIIDNARKFAKPGGPRVTLRTRIVPPSLPGQGARWQMEFADEGMGFDPKESTRIFRRFYRAKPQGPMAIPGTGLGLFLVDAACRTLRLEIEAESAGPGRGAVFRLSGPLEEAA